jgi:hypothetical protein
LIDQFWRRWTKEYLPTLVTRRKWNESIENIGGSVLVKYINTERENWPMGMIKKCYPGNDGVVRVVDVNISDQS